MDKLEKPVTPVQLFNANVTTIMYVSRLLGK